MARQSAAEKKAARQASAGTVGHNQLPKSAYDEFLDRLHVINDRLDEDSATHKADMKKVYDDMAGQLDMPVEVCIGIYKADRREIKAQKKPAKMDSRARSSYLRLAEAYGNDSPLGQYAARMAKAAGATADANKTEDAEEGETAEVAEEAAAAETEG
jgi:hypothetical protein